MDWQSTFDAIELCIESKDFEEAKYLIEEAIKSAEQLLINPELLVEQLKKQREDLAS
jgi:hypothetical protein